MGNKMGGTLVGANVLEKVKPLFIDIENVKPFASRSQELDVTFWEEAGVGLGLGLHWSPT